VDEETLTLSDFPNNRAKAARSIHVLRERRKALG
jgi:hypothetical protein